MITWRSPLLLWLLLLLPLILVFFVWALRLRQRALQRFAEARLLPALTPDLDVRRYRWRAALVTIAVGLLLVALAGPQWGFRWEEVRREGVDIILAVDTSRSMLAEDVKPNRLERAKLGIQDLLKQLRGDRIGLVAFAGTAFTQCPLTLDYGVFAESLRAVDVGIIPKGGTAIAEAIRVSVEALQGHQGKNTVIVLITDGEDNGGEVDDAVKQAVERGIRIYTIGIGSPDGELIPVTVDGQPTFIKDRKGQVVKSRLDETGLQKIAMESNGAYVRAAGPSLGLDQVYNDHISKLDRRELKSTMEKKFEQRYQLPLIGAIALLLIEPLLGSRRRKRSRSQHRLRFWRRSAA
jgi:Ca-activated chloride channel family protein